MRCFVVYAKAMKQCFKCKEVKPLVEFYRHKMMADGHLNKCKGCTRDDVKKNRDGKISYYREYDRKRGNRQGYVYTKDYRERFPAKFRAHQMVGYALRSGRLFPEPCAECGESHSTHAHHDDYAKPLNIRWLCPPCHSAWHQKNGEAINGESP